MAKKPTVGDIIDLRKGRERYYSTLHDLQKEMDDYYELTYTVPLPSKFVGEQITPSSARDWVEIGVNHYTLDNPVAYVPPLEDSDTSRERAGKMEAFYNYWLRKMIPSIKENAKKLLLRGECYFKLWIDDTYYGEDIQGLSTEEKRSFELRKKLLFPLIVLTPDPINVFASPAQSGGFPEDVIEYYQMTVAEAKALCARNNWTWKTDKKETDLVYWTGFYSADWRCFLIGDTAVLKPSVQKNLLGFCPYVHVASGLGQTSYEGKPEYLYRSILYRVKGMINLETQALTQANVINSRWAYPRIEVKGNVDLINKYYGINAIDLDPSEPLVIPEEIDVSFTQGEQILPSMHQYLSQISQRAQVPPVLAGQRTTGVYTGVGEEIQMAHARPLYKLPFNNLESGVSTLLGAGAKTLETVLKYGILIRSPYERGKKSSRSTLNPSDIGGYYDNEVKLLAEPPEATMARKKLGADFKGQQVLSERNVLIEYFDKSSDEADDEMAQLLAEKIARENPLFAQALARVGAERLGMEELKRLMDEAMQQKGTTPTTPNPEGRPPNAVSPPMNEQIPQRQGATPSLESMRTPHEGAEEGVPL